MSNGKAKTTPSIVDDIVKLKRERVKNFGISREMKSPKTNTSVGISGSRGFVSVAGTQSFLNTSGDTMLGAIAFFPKTITVATGVIDLEDVTESGNVTANTSNVNVIGEGNAADDLVTIDGAIGEGQTLYLKAAGFTITIKDGTGNIITPGNVDFVIPDDEGAILIYDTIGGASARWMVLGVEGGSGGGGDNLGDHIATQALKMNDSAIFFDTGLIHSIISGTNVMSYIVDDSSGGKHQFFVDDLVTAQFAVEENVVRVLADTLNFAGTNRFLSGLSVLFWKEGGGSDNITSSTSGVTYNVNATDEHFFAVGGSTVMTVDSAEVLFAQDIDLDGNDLDIGNGNIIDMGAIRFNSASGQIISSSVSGILHQVPSGDGHFFFVAGSQVISVVDQGINMDDKELDFNAGGRVDFSDNATTIGSNGAASALTANPVGYAKVKINGVERQMPYYRVA